MTTERDLRNQMAYAKKIATEEGRAEGLAEGLAEGRKRMALEMVAKLIATGMSKEEAAEFVGISVADLAM